jgi:hypothetical protein
MFLSIMINSLTSRQRRKINRAMGIEAIHYLEGTYLGGGVYRPIVSKLNMRQTLFPHLQIFVQNSLQQGRQCMFHNLSLAVCLRMTCG